MPITGPLTHIDISVGYPAKAIPFYGALLEALGYTRWQIDSDGFREPGATRATWSVPLGEDAHFAIEVRPARAESRDRRYDRYEPGPHHMAFHADGPETVDRVHVAMVAAGAEILDPPTDYSGQRGYSKGYYAAFYADPDGMKLEVAYIPGSNR
jgi:catechol 2,3-dioxygenase-like lactoylglutathione lyase family enzyme